jgi:hypothetical protein
VEAARLAGCGERVSRIMMEGLAAVGLSGSTG